MSPPDNAQRFTGLADIYAAHRPSYPPGVIAELATAATAVDGPRVAVDVGAGTGISTQALATALPDWRIIAAEPNPDMRRRAEALTATHPNIEVSACSAEALSMADASASLVLTAQALHWFASDTFFAETARVLVPGGCLAVLYNNRQSAVSVALSKIESYLEDVGDGYRRDYRDRDIPALLASLDDFSYEKRVREIWLKPTSSDDLVNYFMSRSMLQPIANKVGLSKLRHKIGDIADEHARYGYIDIPFATELDLATRR